MTGLEGVEGALLRLFDSPTYQLLAVILALGVGAAHAVAPGHGKGITAAYLVGAHGRYRDAVYLGAVVASMHTVSAIVLAVAWVNLGVVSSVGTETITRVLQVVAGVVVIAVGVHLLRHRRSHHHHHHHHHHQQHEHVIVSAPAAGSEHDHGPGHGHGGGAGQPHQPAEQVSPWSRRGLLALGLSGGLLPSPSAFLVLVSGLLTGRLLFAVLLVLMFGVGMAATLTGVGVATLKGTALVRAGSSSSAVLSRLSRVIPQVAAFGVLAGGTAYLGIALTSWL